MVLRKISKHITLFSPFLNYLLTQEEHRSLIEQLLVSTVGKQSPVEKKKTSHHRSSFKTRQTNSIVSTRENDKITKLAWTSQTPPANAIVIQIHTTWGIFLTRETTAHSFISPTSKLNFDTISIVLLEIFVKQSFTDNA